MLHVAGLTKANEVFSLVRFVYGFKQSEGFDVVNGKAFPNVFAAIIASPALFSNYCFAHSKPTTTAIGSRASNPIGSKWPFWFRGVTAFYAAVIGGAILPSKPRLLFEINSATQAGSVYSFLPFWMRRSANLIGRECVRRTHPFSELVPCQVGLGASIKESIRLPTATARRRAEPRLVFPIRLNLEGAAACFAMFFNHTKIIPKPRKIGNRTTLVAYKRVEEAYRQPDLFVEPPKAAVQEGFDL